jgi:phytoene synthase
MYGSASVVGFMMCKILGIKEEAYAYANKLGQAFQYINFIRDINEDNALNRQYLPEVNLKKYNLANLEEDYIRQNQENFIKFLRSELEYFYKLIDEAKKGFDFIPRRYRIPIEIATNLYLYTAKIIYKNPEVVYEKKVKPKIMRIFIEALKVILKN